MKLKLKVNCVKKLDLVTTQDLYYLFLLSLLQFSKTCFYLSMYYLFWNPTSFLDAPKCWEFNVLMEPLQDSWWSLFFYFFFLSSFGIKSCKIVEFPVIDRHLTFVISVYQKTIEPMSSKLFSTLSDQLDGQCICMVFQRYLIKINVKCDF